MRGGARQRRGGRSKAPAVPPEGPLVELTVERIGARGDGIAHHQGRPVYLPFTAPGDRVAARLGPFRGEGHAAEDIRVLAEGPRRLPDCRHFGRCGGCALQHLPDAAYAALKRELVVVALTHQGLADAPVEPLRRLAPGTRRRARLAVEAPARLGFHARASHRVVDLAECAVLHPALVALVAPLRQAAPVLWPAPVAGGATLTLAESGLDVLIDLAAAPGLAALETLGTLAEVHDLARLAWRAPESGAPVPVAVRRPMRVVFAGIAVELPIDAFLQASREAEAALTAEVLGGIGAATRIADLFAGLGTFSFALAAQAAVHAVEGSAPALAALAAAAGRAGLAGRVGTERRDLEARPLTPTELARFDAVVFDPPRAGARAQCLALASSAVPRIVAVSCNPASFARDARLLVEGGYRLTRVQPIDQFVWSPHVELTAWFER